MNEVTIERIYKLKHVEATSLAVFVFLLYSKGLFFQQVIQVLRFTYAQIRSIETGYKLTVSKKPTTRF